MMGLGSFRIFFCYHCRKHFWCPAWLVLVCTLNSIKHLASNCFSRLCREGSLTWSIICFNMNWKHGTNVCHQWDSQIWRIWYFWLHEKKTTFLFHGTFFSTAKPPNLGIKWRVDESCEFHRRDQRRAASLGLWLTTKQELSKLLWTPGNFDNKKESQNMFFLTTPPEV